MAPAGYPHDDHGAHGYPNDGQRGDRDDRDPRDDGPLRAEGEYPVVCVGWRVGRAKSKIEQVGLRLRIVKGPDAGQTMLWYGSFHDNSSEITIKSLRALGFDGNDISDRAAWERMIAAATEATAVVQHDTYQNKTRAKVAWINGADVVMQDELNENELRAFGQRMRGVFAQYGGGGSAPAKLDANRGPSGGGRDERRAPPADDRDRQAAFDDRGRGRNGSEDEPDWMRDAGRNGRR
jgi:hypothetical protein